MNRLTNEHLRERAGPVPTHKPLTSRGRDPMRLPPGVEVLAHEIVTTEEKVNVENLVASRRHYLKQRRRG